MTGFLKDQIIDFMKAVKGHFLLHISPLKIPLLLLFELIEVFAKELFLRDLCERNR